MSVEEETITIELAMGKNIPLPSMEVKKIWTLLEYSWRNCFSDSLIETIGKS